jgi:hypothetical protein
MGQNLPFCVMKIKYIMYKVQDSLQQRCTFSYMWRILLARGELLHDRFISLKGEVLAHNTIVSNSATKPTKETNFLMTWKTKVNGTHSEQFKKFLETDKINTLLMTNYFLGLVQALQ